MAAFSISFAYTGDFETFYVPRHAAGSLVVTVAGGKGHDAGANNSLRSRGGDGGTVSGVLDVPPGTRLWLIVGDGAVSNEATRSTAAFGPALGGQGGDGGTGASTAENGGGGGCASEIRLSSSIADRIVVAGGGAGGGGKGTAATNRGGNGGQGIAAGSDGEPAGPRPGLGASTAAAGAGGTSFAAPNGSAGVAGVGGLGASLGTGAVRAGGGGGGGFFGGGGGGNSNTTAGTGGGGSSWADTAYLSSVGSVAANDLPGYITIEWESIPSVWYRGRPWGSA